MRTVMTTAGAVMGEKSGIQKITVFRGIPYAAAPVGDLRWRAPQPHAPWQGVRDCTHFGPAAIQTEHPVGSFYETEFYQGGVEMSEDCLYLNVWTDLSREKQPVLFWIHGGAYMHGFSNEMEFDGDAIAKRGAILVSVNYRVGVLGFMAHPQLTARDGHSGNYGLMDQIFALQWVRENIAAFGGDPDNITIFGQSAGGGSVQSLMTSPLARGLFRRAIIQSAGSPLKSLGGSMTQKMAEENGLAVEKIAGCGLEELQKMDPTELLRIGREVLAQGDGLRFRPCVDGCVLPEDPGTVFARGDAADESLMMGTVTGDAGTFGLAGGDAVSAGGGGHRGHGQGPAAHGEVRGLCVPFLPGNSRGRSPRRLPFQRALVCVRYADALQSPVYGGGLRSVPADDRLVGEFCPHGEPRRRLDGLYGTASGNQLDR